MARPIWSGALTLGLITVPVGLYSAVDEYTVRFHQLQRGTSDRIRNRRVDERTGKEVPAEKIVKGYEVPRGSAPETGRLPTHRPCLAEQDGVVRARREGRGAGALLDEP
ncbi:Ku protein [Streptomyces sp. ET3-23]|uniref:Ku protein n=1 Tax=Streptomyces sp. ET3-23 TaxID=2885643 RepID=UPI0035B2119D